MLLMFSSGSTETVAGQKLRPLKAYLRSGFHCDKVIGKALF
jgi:hypothetical protein